jgi:hypothetical protein
MTETTYERAFRAQWGETPLGSAVDGIKRKRGGKFVENSLRRARLLITFRGSNACGLVAQSVEQCPFKALVVGSSPTQPTISLGRKPTT